MFGFISNIFTPDTVNKTVDGIYNGVDKMFYTEEEKAEATQKQIDTKLKLLPLFEPFKIAQRIIAIIFTVNFILWVWVGIVVYLLIPDKVDGYILLIATFNIGWIMMAIIGWYFTGGVIDSWRNKNEKNK